MKQAPATHETLVGDHEVQGSSNRAFGIVIAVALTIFGLAPMRKGGEPRLWLLAIGAVFLLFALVAPKALAPLNKLWTALGFLLGRIVNPIVLGALFYGVVTPMAAFARWRGADPLRLKLDRSAQSYWLPRQPPGPEPRSIVNQY